MCENPHVDMDRPAVAELMAGVSAALTRPAQFRRGLPTNGLIGLGCWPITPASAALVGQRLDEPEDRMSSAVTGLPAIVGTPGSAGNANRWAALQMLDGTDGAARLVFESTDGRRHAAKLRRWIAIIRLQRSAACQARFVWLLDARTVRWSGGLPPGDLYRGATGLNSEETPILWFRDSGDDDGEGRAFTASGVFGAAGIIDSARVGVTARRIRRQVRLAMTIDPQMWGLSTCRAGTWTARGPQLRIIAAGTPRPLESEAISPWM